MMYTNNFKIQMACNGSHKSFYIERVLTSQGVNLILVDNAIASEVEVIDLLHNLREESSDAIIIGLTSSIPKVYDTLKSNGCDLVWPRPIPKSDLDDGLNKIFRKDLSSSNKSSNNNSLQDCIN